jgi:hypothetical protein
MMMASRRLGVLVLYGLLLLLTINSPATAEEPIASRGLGDVRK